MPARPAEGGGRLIRYRHATAHDAAAIARVHAISWQANYRGILDDAWLDTAVLADRTALWRARLSADDPRRYVAVATTGGGLVGFICAWAGGDARYGSLIDNVHVLPSSAGRGIGTELLAGAFEFLERTASAHGVFLWVYEQNAGARRLYDRLGARHIETVTRDNPGGGTGRLCRYAWKSPADYRDPGERDVLAMLDGQLHAPRTRSAIDRVVAAVRERAAGTGDPIAWQPLPLDLFRDRPAQIRSAWVFLLRAGITSGAERHSNSRQRMMSWHGSGDLQTGAEGAWRTHPLASDPGAPLERRWISVPANTWHQAVVPSSADWVVVSFHSVAAGDLMEERPHGSRHYLDG